MEPGPDAGTETGPTGASDTGAALLAPALGVAPAEGQLTADAGVPTPAAEWTFERTLNPVDVASVVATIALALAAVWYFEPKHSRRTAAFELFSDTLAGAIDGITAIENGILRESPATRHECDLLMVQFRSVSNALWLLSQFALQRKCRKEVTDLVDILGKQRQALYDHITSKDFPSDGWKLDDDRLLRATSMIGLFKRHAAQLRAALIREL